MRSSLLKLPKLPLLLKNVLPVASLSQRTNCVPQTSYIKDCCDWIFIVGSNLSDKSIDLN